MRVSLYSNKESTTPKTGSACVFKVLDSIKTGTYKSQIAKLRIEEDAEKKKEIKGKLPLTTFCGTFSARANDKLKTFSGLACLDFDHVPVEDFKQVRQQTDADAFTFASFVSPSGEGLKVLVKIPPVNNNDDYYDYYVELQKRYDKYFKTDDSTKAIAQACFLSFDPELYINLDADTFTDKYNRPKPVLKTVVNIPLSDQNKIAERLEKWFTKKYSTTVNRNTGLHAYARQMNAFGVDQHVCEQYLLRYEQADFKEREILSLIKSAYRYTAEFNTESFEDEKVVRQIKNLVVAGQDLDRIKAQLSDLDEDDLQAEITKHAELLQDDEFWYYTEKEVIKLATFRFLKYLENNRISKFYPDATSDTFLFIKKEDNFVGEFGEAKIKDFTLADLRRRGAVDAFELMANGLKNFNQTYLSMIKTTEVNINRDTKDLSFLYYRNAAVKTSAAGSEVIEYKDIKDMIWKNQVIDRDIKLSDKSGGEFKTFIWRLSGADKDRYYTLKSVIGYLMHSYQNDSKPKAIIFNDEMISDDTPNGGSGKGLIHKAIGQIKNIVTEDGKKFDPRGQFAYQKVNKDTQIFLMDDVPKNFSFESLFSIVTEGMTVEKKGQDAYQIPFKESPKISITTNYTINGEGASHYRRVFEVEIANHFNDTFTPEDEFKHQFFSDWDEDEWQEFDNFMIRCVQYFLKNGLVESNKVNLDLRKMKNAVGAEFIEFMESKDFTRLITGKKDFRDDFEFKYRNKAKYNTPQRFNKKVKMYCDFHKINYESRKIAGFDSWIFEKTETVEFDPNLPV